tara:strand:- start:193 stop:318 length:126 start_codon:yes stop_codon:yes gene_type:complete
MSIIQVIFLVKIATSYFIIYVNKKALFKKGLRGKDLKKSIT